MPPARGASVWGIRVDGLPELRRAFKALEEFDDLPYAREALLHVQGMAIGEISKRAPDHLKGKAVALPIRGEGTTMKAPIKVEHPSSKTFEFGRHYWYKDFSRGGIIGPVKNRRANARAKGYMKATGKRFYATPGQKATPYIGIKSGGHAIGAIAPEAAEIISRALAKEWSRLANA